MHSHNCVFGATQLLPCCDMWKCNAGNCVSVGVQLVMDIINIWTASLDILCLESLLSETKISWAITKQRLLQYTNGRESPTSKGCITNQHMWIQGVYHQCMGIVSPQRWLPQKMVKRLWMVDGGYWIELIGPYPSLPRVLAPTQNRTHCALAFQLESTAGLSLPY